MSYAWIFTCSKFRALPVVPTATLLPLPAHTAFCQPMFCTWPAAQIAPPGDDIVNASMLSARPVVPTVMVAPSFVAQRRVCQPMFRTWALTQIFSPLKTEIRRASNPRALPVVPADVHSYLYAHLYFCQPMFCTCPVRHNRGVEERVAAVAVLDAPTTRPINSAHAVTICSAFRSLACFNFRAMKPPIIGTAIPWGLAVRWYITQQGFGRY